LKSIQLPSARRGSLEMGNKVQQTVIQKYVLIQFYCPVPGVVA